MFWTNQVQTGQCNRNVVSGRRIAGAMRSLINAKVLLRTVGEEDGERQDCKDGICRIVCW